MLVTIINSELYIIIPLSAKQPGVVSSARKPCLTGSVRKLKNIAADLHNFILKWERLNDEGFSIASQIVNLEISKRYVYDAFSLMK